MAPPPFPAVAQAGAAAVDRAALRRRLRGERRALPRQAREAAAAAACAALLGSGLLRAGRRIGAYLPADGELDTAPLIAAASRAGCRVYVPVIDDFRRRRMHFAALDGGPLRRNRWGLDEPCTGARLDPRWLDLVIAPCVAVDAAGRRLGRGAGFYDRCFHFLALRTSWQMPRLVAYAYDFQLLAQLPAERWDVPVWGIATPAGFGRCA